MSIGLGPIAIPKEKRKQKYTIFFLKFFLLGLHFPFIISTRLVVVDSLLFFLPDILSIKGPFDGQDMIEAGYDIKLDRDRI